MTETPGPAEPRPSAEPAAEPAAESSVEPPAEPPPATPSRQASAPAPEPTAVPPHPATPVPVAGHPPHMTRTWIAAVAAAVLLVGGGIGGYAIGAAGDHHDRGPAWDRQHGPRDGFRGGEPGRGGPWNR